MNAEDRGRHSKAWQLNSGDWMAAEEGGGFVLDRTTQRHAVPEAVSEDDLRVLMQCGRSSAAAPGLYPPEFKFDPQTGHALLRPAAAPAASWIPPHGAADILQRSARPSRGLRQAARPLRLSEPSLRRADTDPDDSLSMPPEGSYEFFSLPAGTRAPVLLALDPAKGLLYARLPASGRWEPVDYEGRGMLEVSGIPREDWRAEVALDGSASRIFFGTDSGLACVRVDVPGLRFGVDYIGAGKALGAPIHFAERIWVPLDAGAGSVRFASADAQGAPGPVVALSLAGLDTGALHAPLVSGRIAIWPAERGQLLLRMLSNGDCEASFRPWPDNLRPDFRFGCASLSPVGHLSQLCFDDAAGTYCYLELGIDQPARHPVQAPRLCSGSVNYRFAARFKTDPWVEPEHGDDGATDEVVMPLLESQDGVVVGIKLATAKSLDEVLQSVDRTPAKLVMDDGSTEIAFHSFSVSEPWRLRLFVHDGLLWAYHPLITRIDGWKLQA